MVRFFFQALKRCGTTSFCNLFAGDEHVQTVGQAAQSFVGDERLLQSANGASSLGVPETKRCGEGADGRPGRRGR